MRKADSMKKTILTIIIFAAASISYAADPFNDGFETGRPQSYLENTGALYEDATMSKVDGMKGRNCLVLRYDNETTADFHAVPVSKGKLYRLSFRGKWDNRYTHENNPVMRQACYVSWRPATEALPSAEVSFLAEDLSELDQKFSVFFTLPWGEWRSYVAVFVPPHDAAMMQLKVKSGRNPGTYYLDKVEFNEVAWKDSSLTIKFAGDEPFAGNILGISLDEGSIEKNGRNAVFSGYGKVTQMIPLEKGKYRIEAKGEALSGYRNFDVIFSGADGKDIGKPTTSKDILNEPLSFEMQPKAEYIKLRIYNHLLDEVKITKVP